MAFAAALLLAALGDGPLESRSVAGNQTASALVERSPALGIDFDPNNEASRHPSAADSQAFEAAGTRAWLEAQLTVPDDSIGEPPAELRTYLEERADALGAVTGALEKGSPEWRERRVEGETQPDLLASLRLHRVLLCAALVAVRKGDSMEAERFLEASWSLARPNAESSDLLRQIIAIASSKWQAGVLRKFPEASPVWIDRASNDKTWRAVIEAYFSELKPKKPDPLKAPEREIDLQPSESWDEVYKKGPEAISGGLVKLGPCEGANLDEGGYWKLVERELSLTSDPMAKEIRQNYREVFLPGMRDTFRRAGRMSVDWELTLEILRLRQARDQDPEHRWPERMDNIISTTCPAFAYSYRSGAKGMEIRFDGELANSSAPFVLPLTFRSAPSKAEKAEPD